MTQFQLDQVVALASTYHQEGRQLEIPSRIKTKQLKIEFHPCSPRSDAHFRRLFAVIREFLDALDADHSR
jgi:hypothetical protein